MPHPPIPASHDLQQLLSGLQQEKYAVIEALTHRIGTIIPTIQLNEDHTAVDVYLVLCDSLIHQVFNYLRYHRLILLPYIADLLNKEDEGHDCRACSSSCTIRHVEQVERIKATHIALKEDMDLLQRASLALAAMAPYGDALKTLRSDMMSLNTNLSDLMFIEASALIPMMEDLQRNIGAHG
jgi:hypothetical protein